ncbi:MAG: SUMF1/EgtB/PvdO family nonheme iron enzyme, partial [Candidatus Aceula meridiana]|nr:SUMF1/EgtB/PvdO family nonheme iron enzyme [Candidatus Aceula meridiana]
TGTNNDALWVFVKYYHPDDTEWRHATMSIAGTNPTGFGAPSGLVDVIVPKDKKGFFLQRSEANAGGGTVNLSDLSGDNQYVTFTWDYGHDSDALVAAGGTAIDVANAALDFKIFAIEMVYIPEGSFVAMGPGTTTTANSPSAVGGQGFLYNNQSGTKTYTEWWPVDNENAITVYGNALDTPKGYYDISDGPYTIPATFPKGYNPFYLMKYEISQGQYRDFLNNLDSAQAENRCSASASANYCAFATNQATVSNRGGVYRTSSGYGCDLNDNGTPDETTDGEWVAMNFLDSNDLAAFLDWAALRPMTELEFEKAARGPDQTSGDIYVWGTTSLEATTTLADAGTSSELPNQGNLNYTSCSPAGPFRVGSYADAASTRTAAGAGYYGNMNLGGNVVEMAVDVTASDNRLFEGSNGDGVLTSSGYANNPDWPGYSDGAVTTGSQFFRGSSHSLAATSAYVYAHPTYFDLPAGRNTLLGGRGSRTSPTILMTQ